MHGRLKVRTSEEEKARKENERQEKLKVFKHAMQKIYLKRQNGELDNELLTITGNVLTSNPDIYTLWNIRREIIIKIRETNDNCEEIKQLHDNELQLTEYCLKVNPKSYCAWHQRQWVLTTRSDPDWKAELDLCNKYIKFDERNFHTWDYRRFVVSQCKPPLKEEFDYTTEKLYDNFSNYSAWHYRSKILVNLYPDKEGGRPIKDSQHKHELKIVQSAAFTDPDDTSAWFYLRWLLGAVKTNISPVVCTVTKTKITVAYSENVSQSFVQSKIRLIINGSIVQGTWTSCLGNEYDVLWILKHNEDIGDDLCVKLEYEISEGDKQIINCKKYKPFMYIGKNEISFQKKYSDPVIQELQEQLVSCRQLLELEPDSKWTLFTTTVFLYSIDAKKYHKEIISGLMKLKTVDKMRSGYYDDMITKWNFEYHLPSDYNGDVDLSVIIKFSEKITCLPHLHYYSYCEIVDLSGQNLTSEVLPSLIVLQHCKKLNLANNKLTTLAKFPNLALEELDIHGNQIKIEDVEELKKKNRWKIDF